MFRPLKLGLTAALASLALGVAPVAAQEPAVAPDPSPRLVDLLTLETVGDVVALFALSALRTQAEVSFEHLSNDLARGSLGLSGVTIRPNLPWDQAGQCVIGVERASAGQDYPGALEARSRGFVGLVGVTMPVACLEPDVATMLRAVGLQTITLDQARLSGRGDLSTGALSFDLSLAVNGVATLDVTATGVPVFIREPALPATPGSVGSTDFATMGAFRVTELTATLADRGGWARIAPVLPGELRNPEAVRAIGTEMLTSAMGQGGTRRLSAVEQRFIDDLMEQAARFVQEPGEITIEADLPPGGVVVGEATVAGPLDLIVALGLTARAAPSARADLLTAQDLALLAASRETGADGDTDGTTDTGPGIETVGGSPEARLELARRLLEGDGVPRAPSAVPALLEPLAGTDRAGEAARLVAEALLAADPLAAYAAALRTAEAGAGGTVALLDAIEARIGSPATLAAQGPLPAASVAEAAMEGAGDPRRLRQAALDRLYGLGAPRNYAGALYFALLAEAAGDLAAPSLVAEIDARFSGRGLEAAAAWAEARAAAEARALEDWIALDLGAALRSD